MSLFGLLDDDPFLGGHMRRMNNMMNSMMGDFFGSPFGGMMPIEHNPGRQSREIAHRSAPNFPLMGGGVFCPVGFPDIGSMFNNMNGMANPGNSHSFSSSTFMTMSSGPDGTPQVYQASTSTRQGPGGLRETKKTVADSRTGVKKMAIGHHIGERAHIVEREQNLYSGEREENQEYVNVEEEEAEQFDREWETRTRASLNPHHSIAYPGHHRRHRETSQLALPPAPSSRPGSSRATSRRSQYPNHQYHPGSYPRNDKSEYGKKRKQSTMEADINGKSLTKKKSNKGEAVVIYDSDSD